MGCFVYLICSLARGVKAVCIRFLLVDQLPDSDSAVGVADTNVGFPT
jgi:hypothetical protein